MSVLDFTKTISNGVLEKAKSFKSDWSVNDDTNPAYIKNRPFYETEPVETILLDQTLDFEDWDDGVYGWETVEYQKFIIGQSYTVIWDNEVYSDLVCFDDYGIPTIGVSMDDRNFSTYPFSIGTDGGWMWIGTNSTENSHTVKITVIQSTITKIDKKYLPKLVGKETQGNKYIVYDEENDAEYTVTAEQGAEIFNDYAYNIATGEYSHAEGCETTAVGFAAHAEGEDSKAFGSYSHAEGLDTIASDQAAHAEGTSSKATGSNSHAEGANTLASNSASHAEGASTTASGAWSHAEGIHTTASGNCSHAEGGNRNTSDTSFISSLTVASSEYSGLTKNIVIEGPVAYGVQSHAEGTQTLAFGYSSHAEGFNTKAFGNYSHAEGYKTTATGNHSHAEGNNTITTGTYSHAEGYGTKASGNCSHAEGASSEASGMNAHSEGQATRAFGAQSHAEGYSTYAVGIKSHAGGDNTSATGENAYAEGYKTVSSGDSAHAQGQETIASGVASHAAGWESVASGFASFASGASANAGGDYSSAMGLRTVSSGRSQHVIGENNIVDKKYVASSSAKNDTIPFNSAVTYYSSNYSFDEKTGLFTLASPSSGATTTISTSLANKYFMCNGKSKSNVMYKAASSFNGNMDATNYIFTPTTNYTKYTSSIESTGRGTYVHIVGNGTSNTARSNAHTLDWDGNAWFAGNVYVGADNKELATKEYVDSRGGSSGGVTSWNDLEDKPFGLIDNDNENYILPSTQMALASQDEAMTMHILGNSIEGVALGVDYIVNYNGNNYICTAQLIDAGDGMVVTGLGNTAALGGEDTGEPFALAILPPEVVSTLGFGVALYSLDMASSVTISISSNKTIKKLDNKFLNLDWLPTRNKTVEMLYDQETSFNDAGQSLHAGKVYFEIVPGEEYTINWNGTTYNCIGQLIPMEGTFFPVIGNASLVNSNNPNTGEPFAILIFLNTHTLMYSAMFNKDISLSVTGPKYTYNTMPSQYMPDETNALALKKLTFIDADLDTASFHMAAGKQLYWPGSINAQYRISVNGQDLATIAYVNEKLGDIEALLAAI